LAAGAVAGVFGLEADAVFNRLANFGAADI
jgi:hypothetical protein